MSFSFFDDPDAVPREPMDFERSLTSYIPEEWRELLADELGSGWMQDLERKVDAEYKLTDIFPPREKVFNALKLCPLDKIRVVILGQDPYINPGEAEGLAFSVPVNCRRKGKLYMPPSVRNMYREITGDMKFKPRNGCLEHWARQGVLLLNHTLTVRAHKSNSHAHLGWGELTNAIIKHLSRTKPNLVFMLWGRNAQSALGMIQNQEQHLILQCAHPSPLSASRGFFGCGHFSKCNQYLKTLNATPIQWLE